jgi:hypothetical protein
MQNICGKVNEAYANYKNNKKLKNQQAEAQK